MSIECARVEQEESTQVRLLRQVAIVLMRRSTETVAFSIQGNVTVTPGRDVAMDSRLSSIDLYGDTPLTSDRLLFICASHAASGGLHKALAFELHLDTLQRLLHDSATVICESRRARDKKDKTATMFKPHYRKIR